MERIDEIEVLSDPRAALERARTSGETLEILKDGRSDARLIPAPSPRRVLPGGSRAVMALTDPADSLDELLTADDVEAWYPQTSPAERCISWTAEARSDFAADNRDSFLSSSYLTTPPSHSLPS